MTAILLLVVCFVFAAYWWKARRYWSTLSYWVNYNDTGWRHVVLYLRPGDKVDLGLGTVISDEE